MTIQDVLLEDLEAMRSQAKQPAKISAVPGYPALAERMGLLPTSAIFRRFASLNTRNLLYYQAELLTIEKKLRVKEIADSKSNIDVKRWYATNWLFLSQSREGDQEQLRLVRSMREKLKEYNEALVLQAKIMALPKPGESDLKYIKAYLETEGSSALSGPDSDVWGEYDSPHSESGDLIALLPRSDEDPFSNWLTQKGIQYIFDSACCRSRNPSPKYGMVGIEDTTLFRLTYGLSTALASLLPVASTIILYYVESARLRLGIIAIFNVVVSFCMSYFAKAKRIEIFAAVFAFTAIQVVFVQSGVGNSDDGSG